eukprot:6396109-Amphidinium_carterae.1
MPSTGFASESCARMPYNKGRNLKRIESHQLAALFQRLSWHFFAPCDNSDRHAQTMRMLLDKPPWWASACNLKACEAYGADIGCCATLTWNPSEVAQTAVRIAKQR